MPRKRKDSETPRHERTESMRERRSEYGNRTGPRNGTGPRAKSGTCARKR